MHARIQRQGAKPRRRHGRRLRATLVLSLGLLAGLPAAAGAAPPGALDPGFGSNGGVGLPAGQQLFGVAVGSDGSVFAVGQSSGRVLVEHFTSAGRPAGTYLGPSGYARGVAIQPDGKVVIAGTTGGATLVERLTAGLALDGSFGSGGVATALPGSFANGVAVGPDGSIVAAGSGAVPAPVVSQAAVAKFTSAGRPAFSEKLNFGNLSLATGVAVQTDGKIVLVGRQTPLQVTNGVVARLTSGGSLDSSFAGGAITYHYPGGGYTALTSVALQTNGQIVAGGVALADTSKALFLRVNGNGSLDGGFGSGGARVISSGQNVSVLEDPIGVYGVGIAGGGRIVGAGNFENTAVQVDAALYGVSAGGAPEPAFGGTGVVRPAPGTFEECALAVAPDGSLVTVGGTVSTIPDASPCSPRASNAGFVERFGGFGPPPGGGGPGPGPGTKLSVTLRGLPGRIKTSTVARHGLRVGFTCNEACSAKLSLVVSGGTARRLGIRTSVRRCTTVHGKRRCHTTRGFLAVTIASGQGSLGAAGTRFVTLRLNRSFVRTLERQRRVSVSLQVAVTSTQTHNGRTLQKGLTFTR